LIDLRTISASSGVAAICFLARRLLLSEKRTAPRQGQGQGRAIALGAGVIEINRRPNWSC
jgi:hypothetical protein